MSLSTETCLAIVADYVLVDKANKPVYSLEEICVRNKTSSPVVYEVLNRYNVTLRHRIFTEEFKKQVIADYLAKKPNGEPLFTVSEINKRYSVYNALYIFLREAGIPLRNRVPAVRDQVRGKVKRNSVEDLEYRISEVISDYNKEDRWGRRYYTISDLSIRYNCVSQTIYDLLSLARSKYKLRVDFRR